MNKEALSGICLASSAARRRFFLDAQHLTRVVGHVFHTGQHAGTAVIALQQLVFRHQRNVAACGLVGDAKMGASFSTVT
jgi:hypothetical protein